MDPQISGRFVQILKSSRVRLSLLVWGLLLLCLPQFISAQDDLGDAPLGDVARSFRRKPVPAEAVVDNDNLSKVVDDAESRRAAGSSPVFSLDAGGKSFHVSSPDVTCSLSFSAKTTSLVADPLLLDELPSSELAKLDGPATLDGDSLQVSMNNGTSWELREVVIGLTILRRPEASNASSSLRYGRARIGRATIVPAVADASQQGQDSFQKQPDVTVLLRVKGSAAPSATAIFRTSLNFALFPDQEWHWAIVKAKGIRPPTLPVTIAQPAGDPPPALHDSGTEPLLANPSSSNLSSPKPDAATH
ncbi:MAG TPA: hypothetical protein VFF64_26060 [Candidatus Eremiobacteraceae bacterium]|nr:hypothetical protein [Candidatus Eremiobacteraceae bacterium]